MLAANIAVLWQFRRMADSSKRLNRADQISLAAVRVLQDTVTLRNRLAGLADTHDGPEFTGEAGALRRKLLEDVAHAQQLFMAATDVEHDPVILSTLQTLEVTLPSQVGSVMALAAVNDWQAVRLRLTDQVQGLMDLSSLLVERVDREVSYQRAQAIERTQRASRELFLVLPATAVLTMLMAVVLGWRVTRTITEPLSELYTGAQALARGEFQHEVKVTGEDELATLGTGFNYAVRRLRELYDQLRDSEEQWRAAFESNPTMYFMLDRAGNILSVNLFGAEHLGYRTSELAGQGVLNVFYEPDREAVQRHAEACFQQLGRMRRWEARKIRKDGTMLWVRETANAVLLKSRPVLLVVCEDITEQKRAEEAARRSESELRDLIENVPAIVFVALPGPSSAFVSRGWREYTGLSAEDTAGFGWRQVVHPEDLERHMERWRVCAATGEPFEDEARFRRAADGEYRWFLDRAVPLRGEAGNILKWYGVLTDIEDRKRAEQALIRSEAYLAEAQRLTHTGSWAYNPATNQTLYWSEEMLRIYGLDPRLGPPDADDASRITHPEDRAGLSQAVRKGFSEKADFTTEYRLLLPDGTVKHLHVIWHPVVDNNRELLEYLGTAADVTERKRAEEALRRSEAYLAEAQRLTHTGSWAWDPKNQGMHYCSEETFRILELNPHEKFPIGEKLWERLVPEDYGRARETALKAFREKSDFADQWRVVLPHGAVKHLNVIGHPVFDKAGEVTEYVGTLVDVTEGKRAGEERERLRQLEADLAHINRVSMLGELAASLAHEVKQPIAAAVTDARTCLRWLQRDTPDIAEACETASRIVKDVNRAADLIDRVRSLYRRDKPQRNLVDINDIILEMIALLHDRASQHSISIRTNLEARLPVITADRVQLQQVLMNLILNGIEAMNETGGELTVTSKNAEDDQLLVSVTDSGIGLPAAGAERLFEAFFTTKPQGTGMGLSVCRRIIESHGGRLWATANEACGATFHFALPTKHEAQV